MAYRTLFLTERGLRQYVKRALREGCSGAEIIDALLMAFPTLGLSKIVWATDVILAMQLPEFIEVDLSAAEKGATVHTGDLKLPAGVKIVTHGRKDITIATVVEPVEEVIAAPVAAAADDKKGKKKK